MKVIKCERVGTHVFGGLLWFTPHCLVWIAGLIAHALCSIPLFRYGGGALQWSVRKSVRPCMAGLVAKFVIASNQAIPVLGFFHATSWYWRLLLIPEAVVINREVKWVWGRVRTGLPWVRWNQTRWTRKEVRWVINERPMVAIVNTAITWKTVQQVRWSSRKTWVVHLSQSARAPDSALAEACIGVVSTIEISRQTSLNPRPWSGLCGAELT